MICRLRHRLYSYSTRVFRGNTYSFRWALRNMLSENGEELLVTCASYN
jgi:hypothetical protein